MNWSDTNWFVPTSEGGLGLECYKTIYQLELFVITLAFKIFEPQLTGCSVILRTDNKGVAVSINAMKSDLESGMELLRDLTLTCMSLQILATTVHI